MRVVDGSIKRETTLNGQRITFVTKDIKESDKIFSDWKDKPLQVEIKPVRKSRSLNANSYMWILCDKIAAALLTTKEKVYRKAVAEVGVFDDVAVHGKALPTFLSHWDSRGIGWFTEVFSSPLKGCNRVRCYYGSSTYDSKQMSRLIDYIVDEAKGLDIETETPDNIERMKQMWEAQ